MSIAALTYVWENSKQEGGSLLVMLALADYANDKGESFPSIKTLSRKSRLGERQTQRVIQQLAVSGEIEVIPNAGRNGVNIYRILRCRGDKMSGVTSVTPGGDMGDAKGVTPASPKPSGNRNESPVLVLSGEGGGGRKKHKAGHVNGSHPAQATIEAFCISLGLPKSDGELMMMKWNADGWPKNWMDKLRYWQRREWLPSQQPARFSNNGRGMQPAASRVSPKGWSDWLASKPDYARRCQGLPYLGCPEFIRIEFTHDRKLQTA